MGAVPPHWRLWRHHPAAAPTDGSGGIIPPPLPLTAPAAVAVVKADTSSRGAKGLGPQSPSYQTPPPAHLKAEWAAQLHRRQGSRPRSGAQSAPLTPVLGAAILPVGGQGGFRFGQVRCSVTAGAVAPAGSGAAVATAGSGGAVAPAGSGGAVATAGSGAAVATAGSGGAVAPAGSGGAVATAGSGAGVGVEVPSSKDFNTFFNRLQYLLQYRFNRVQGRLQAN